ncbi:MAG TPA: twin-arginine translocase TatA/TatE family subunit [Desulfobacterales bacterium]|nr:twin-arginine translocase TatA/TatE family subunit [Desulfobacterales bacterium]
MFGFGPTELLIIALIVLLIFGAKRLPEIGKGLGGAIREFKKIKKDLSNDQGALPNEQDKTNHSAQATSGGLEAKVKEKVLEQVPGVKKVVDAKKKVDKAKEILK